MRELRPGPDDCSDVGGAAHDSRNRQIQRRRVWRTIWQWQ